MDYTKYLSDCDRIGAIGEAYHDCLEDTYQKVQQEVTRLEYGIIGDNSHIHRGYYCPSPVLDIVVGGVKRGRVSKKFPKKEPDTIFGFNAQDQLVIIEWSECKEFVLWSVEPLALFGSFFAIFYGEISV